MQVINTFEISYVKAVSTNQYSEIKLVRIGDKLLVEKLDRQGVSREHRIMSSLSHKNIGKVFQNTSTTSFLMKYYSGGTLSKTTPVKPESLLPYFYQMCESLKYTHSQGFCHLDLKLSNFLLTKNNKIKLIDFGHSRYGKNLINIRLGTDKYNSPERFKGSYDGYKADIYSLGICLLEMIVGLVPFLKSSGDCKYYSMYRDDKEKFWGYIEKYLFKLKCSGKDVQDWVDENVSDLIDLMLAENPDDRPNITEVLSHKAFGLL
jgi:serine/threonine protein kinase